MILDEKLLEQFKSLYEKQDILSNINNNDLFSIYGFSEIHCLDAIGKSEDANVTYISSYLNITKSAVSKITRRLNQKGLITSYQKENNKKAVYFSLTAKGEDVYKLHEIAHDNWEEREKLFFSTIDVKEKEIIDSFLEKYNKFLETLITEGKEKC